MSQYPRTAEDIIRSGDLKRCYIRELLDLAREMGIPQDTDYKPDVLRAIKAEARSRGWLA